MMKFDMGRARAAFLAAQALPAPAKPALVPTLERTGFVRTLGGVDVYLALRARVPGMTRADLDRAVETGQAQVVPSVRGCIYLVPKRDVPFALRAADLLSRARAEREQKKAGIRKGEVEKVAGEAHAALKRKGPMTTDALRRALPEGVVRSLGEAGKKVGVSSTLPPALRRLEFEGRIERTLPGGRLDTERYLWRTAEKNPFDGARLSDDAMDLWARLAEIYFRAAGLGTIKDFGAWAGISQRDARTASERVGLVPAEVEGAEEPHFALKGTLDDLLGAKHTADAVAFLPFEDNLVALRPGPAALVEPAHHKIRVPVWGSSKDTTLGEARHMSFRSVVAEGQVSGFWEYDPDSKKVVWASFARLKPATRKRVDESAAELSRFLAEEIGHARSFSIETDDDLRKRAAMVRKLSA